jgi:hypothetical protein
MSLKETLNKPLPVPYSESELDTAFREVCKDLAEMRAALAQTNEALGEYLRRCEQWDTNKDIGLESLYNTFFKEHS